MSKNSITKQAESEFTNVEELLVEFGTDLVDELGRSLPRSKNASGRLRRSIHFEIEIQKRFIDFNLLLEEYYKNVDEGRKPGKFPPIDPLIDWLIHKRLGAKLDSSKPSKSQADPTQLRRSCLLYTSPSPRDFG